MPVRLFRLVSVLVCLTVLPSGCDWAMFRDGTAHSGYNAGENAIGTTNVGHLSTVWTAATGGSVYSSPAVTNGIVYIGSDDGKVYAFDAAGSTACSGSLKT